MLKRHWTPHYLVGRVVTAVFHFCNPNAPWLTARAIRLIEKLLRPNYVGVEFGSGRSTAWFAQRCERLVSIENDRGWYENVAARLREAKITNVDLRHWATGAEYVSAINHVGPIHFALIDGKRRIETAMKAAPLIVPGGFLVLDNAERYITKNPSPEWALFLELMKDWKYIPTTNGVWRTDIWIKTER